MKTGRLPKQIEYKEKYGPLSEYLDYCELVKRVSLIDEEAALLLTRQWELKSLFEPSHNMMYDGDLACVFDWAAHHKGGDYWGSIYILLSKNA